MWNFLHFLIMQKNGIIKENYDGKFERCKVTSDKIMATI